MSKTLGIDKVSIAPKQCREIHDSNAREDINLILVDVKSLGLLLLSLQTLLCTIGKSTHLVCEIDTGSVLDQFPHNHYISLLRSHHEGCLLRLLGAIRQNYTALAAMSMYRNKRAWWHHSYVIMCSWPMSIGDRLFPYSTFLLASFPGSPHAQTKNQRKGESLVKLITWEMSSIGREN